jgi:signal transduction histidine kinase
MRPLDRLPTIRAKLGSTIVFAVAATIVLIYFLLGFALRGAARDADSLELLQIAHRVASGHPPKNLPKDVSLVVLRDDVFSGTVGGVEPPRFRDGRVHWGVSEGLQFASVPVRDAEGRVESTVYATKRAPGPGFLGVLRATYRFLRGYWWQLLLTGGAAAAIALGMARLLARGMTQPLRDMADAARRMEAGEYGQRVHTSSRDEVGRLAAAFNRMSAELDSLEQLRRELVANVSHELKTPISALRAHLENLLDGVEEPDPATLQVMLAQSERLGRLVDQLLDLSRLESGEVPLEREPIPLRPLVRRVVSEIEVARPGKGVEVSNQVPEDLPPVLADRERIHQVLYNLLDNAVRFTPPGGAVTVSARRENGAFEVRVADTGPGIAPEHLPRLFERFYRVDPARSREGGGTGIGLAIARSVVEAHGGRIRAESRPGEGATFTFELPVSTAATDTRRDA